MMIDVWSFVDDVQSLPGKLKHLEDIIDKIQMLTVEHAIFICEHTGHRFGGLLTSRHGLAVVDKLSRQSHEAVVF